jgi:acetate kinase
MTDHLLTLNAGSSSLKFALFAREGLALRAIGQIEGLGTDPRLTLKDGAGAKILVDDLDGDAAVRDHAGAMTTILARLAALLPEARIVGIGHRVVHGGTRFTEPVIVTGEIEAELAGLGALAPLHQPHNLAGIAAARAAFPEAPQIACFDTAFHSGRRFVDDCFAIPRALYDEGVRRYGFHGLSYEYVTGRLGEIAPYHAGARVVVCHLGSGASMCATRDRRSVASTMGFTALDGLPMGTRPGQLDPGVLLHLMSTKGMDAKALSDLLYKESGLKGLSGISNDMRDLLASEHPHAKQAVDYFVFRARRELGAMAAVLEGLDAIVFCGGIGENAAPIREAILTGMDWIGVELDHDRNRAGETIISSERSRVRVFIIPTNEEAVIARHTARLVG